MFVISRFINESVELTLETDGEAGRLETSEGKCSIRIKPVQIGGKRVCIAIEAPDYVRITRPEAGRKGGRISNQERVQRFPAMGSRTQEPVEELEAPQLLERTPERT